MSTRAPALWTLPLVLVCAAVFGGCARVPASTDAPPREMPRTDPPCDPGEHQRPVSLPTTGPRCGDGEVAPSPHACTRRCTGGCGARFVCGEPSCVTLPEACDGADLRGQSCASLGFAGGGLSCAADCRRLDISGCAVCPDRAGLTCRPVSIPAARNLRLYTGGPSPLLAWATVEGARARTWVAFVDDQLRSSSRVSVGPGELTDARPSGAGYYLVLVSAHSRALRVAHLAPGRRPRDVLRRAIRRGTLAGRLFDTPRGGQLLVVEQRGRRIPGRETAVQYTAHLLNRSGDRVELPDLPVSGSRADGPGGRNLTRVISFPTATGTAARSSRAIATVSWTAGGADHHLRLRRESTPAPHALATPQPLDRPFARSIDQAQLRLATRGGGFQDAITVGSARHRLTGPTPRVAGAQPTRPAQIQLAVPASERFEVVCRTAPHGGHRVGFVQLTQRVVIPASVPVSAARALRAHDPARRIVLLRIAGAR